MDDKSRTKVVVSSVVSVLLTAIVAFTAIKYGDAEEEVTQAQVDALAAQLGAASAINFKRRTEVVYEQKLVVPAEVTDCRHISALLPERALPIGYRIEALAIPLNGQAVCQLSYEGFRASFQGHGI